MAPFNITLTVIPLYITHNGCYAKSLNLILCLGIFLKVVAYLCCNLVHFFWGPFLLAVLQRAMFVWRQKWVLVKSSNPLIFQHCLNGRGINLRSIPLNWTYHGLEIQLFCYTINSQIMDNKNSLHTWSIPIIIPYDDIFSRNWCLVTFCLDFSAG